MRIAILGTKGVPGRHGVEVVVDSLIPHLVQLGHEVTVYGYQGYAQDTDDYHGARIVAVPGSSNKNLEMISHMWNASLATRREAYDIVHVHSVDPCLIAWLPRSRLGVVATSHGQAYLRKKWSMSAKTASRLAERCFMRLPKAITSVSKPLADYYKARYGREVLYIPNGVQSRPIPEERWLDKWGLKSRSFLFCSAGRVERTKGLHTLLAAYTRLKPGLPLIIAGGGSGSDPAYQQELNRDKAEGIRFVGFLTGEEFHALYAHARVFVFPSEYEAMSMALLEGLSFGAPTVYSDIPENRAIAEGLGYSFRVSDAGSLVKTLQSVLDLPQEAIAMGEKARRYVREHHDWAAIAREYHAVYMGLDGVKHP
jgi:glycosyltransferase involved in cell wall biosynthesis